ncbi:DsbA family protein [Cellulomonas shaoxiangyii]|uniref:Disulfide bond formation protein DsbA n=1 Tax=Cellulomonas shaoxiangyii TaxID=2566013 RepID=A0A4P7SPD9_9CELL|nr:thioredoxin domain-containing protein [Cellulomonas shaoxiangyii]QCB94583.1 disulfide bond formation protein DsbA [Cellulomonas shaoxiangyii]TGY85011.1 disulfide bond formation protein DsbA [Cellulomonas shaoxiangyii]
MPTNDPRPTKAVRRDEARAKAIAMRQEQERKAKRNRLLAIGGLIAAIAVLAAVVIVIVRQGAERAEAYGTVQYGAGAEGLVVPAVDEVEAPSVAEGGGIPVSAAGVGEAAEDGTTVTVYFDFMCPYCGQFDAANGAELEQLAAQEGITIEYKPIAFLDGTSQGTFYSTRAANAVAVVADQDPEHMTAFMTALYENQPEEGSSGLSDAEIAELATEVGVPADVTEQFTATVDGTYEVAADDGTEERDGTWRTFAPWVLAATEQANTDLGGVSTPSVLIDGEKWEGDLYTPGPLTEAVLAAAAQG